jgi:hypothetical protein
MKIGLAPGAALAAACMLFSTAASAQAPGRPAAQVTGVTGVTRVTKDYTETATVDGGQVVSFPGDELPGDASDPYMGLVRRPPGVIRANLIRPRMNFVSELLKSVENL